MNRLSVKLGAMLLLVGAWGTGLTQEDPDGPVAIINVTATELQQELDGKLDFYADNLPELYDLVDRVLLPAFDVEYCGKQVLGRTHWTAATTEQQERFIATFYKFLVRTYAKAILEFDQRRMSVDSNPSYSKDRKKALVKTRMQLSDGDDAQIAYALRDNNDEWLIYDVRVDGISYVQNYRSQFDAEISTNGIDAVIERLEKEAEELTAEAEEG